MKEKKAIIVVFICLLLAMSAIPVYAKVVDEGQADILAMYYRSASATLLISSNGGATASGSITGLAGTTTKTTVHLYLQQYKNGEWVDVDDWLETGEAVSRTLTKTKTVTKGYAYRAKASCYAYSGSKYEHVTKYSTTVNYGI